MEERTGVLFRTAEILRRRKFEFNAWLVLEVGKNYDEAEADTAEAIDFLELYARQALVLDKAEPVVQLPGERGLLRYIALGVGAVISPWNFPNAIALGMTGASLVCGNTVILKPSSDSPTIAAKFFEALEEAGMPAGVVNFCPGSGATFGNGLVAHPKTRYIAFTGSRDVGLDIHSRAAQPQKGQIWIKRTVLEMGGKDTIVVDADADLDAAVQGVAAAAFGFQGQKCSACSRAIVHQDIYDEFLEKLKAVAEKIAIGLPEDNVRMGPVINEGAMKSILNYIEIGKQEGRADHGRRARSGRRLFHPAHRDRRYRSDGAPLAGRDLRTGAGRDQGEGFRRRPGDCQQHRVRTDRRGLHHQRRQDRARQARVPRRQPVYQSQVHRRGGRRPPVRRIQYVRYGFEGRRHGLPVPVQPGEIDRTEAVGSNLPRIVCHRRSMRIAPPSTCSVAPVI